MLDIRRLRVPALAAYDDACAAALRRSPPEEKRR